MANYPDTVGGHLDRIDDASKALAQKAFNLGLKTTGGATIIPDGENRSAIDEVANAISNILENDGDDATFDAGTNITTDPPTVNVEAGYYKNDVTVKIPTATRANTTMIVSNTESDEGEPEIMLKAVNDQKTGYVFGSQQTAEKYITQSVSGKTVTASVDGVSISKSVDDGSYEVTTSDSTVQEATVDAEGTNIVLTELEAGAAPSAGATDAYIKVSGNVSAIVTATATIKKAGYIEEGSQSTDELVEVSTAPKYYHLNNGTVELSGGSLSPGEGSAGVSITGANFYLTESTSKPAGGKKYITATGSGKVNRAAIGYKTTSGVVGNATVDGEDLEENNLGAFGATEETSNIKTKFYTIPDTVVDTQSGTASENDILDGYKAWVGGQEITGKVPAHGVITGSINPLEKTYWSFDEAGYAPGRVSSVEISITDHLLARLQKI